jgi:hypothetical protein
MEYLCADPGLGWQGFEFALKKLVTGLSGEQRS